MSTSPNTQHNGCEIHTVTNDVHVHSMRPLMSPAVLLDTLPASDTQIDVVYQARRNIQASLKGDSDKLVVIVGPCSIHDATAALEYGKRLSDISHQFQNDLVILMRCYFAKPRTTIGWKGFLNDPDLNGTYHINDGIRRARELVLELLDMGLPVATEFLDPITPQYFSDVVSWGAIGARTAESQLHRELASGLSMPIGFKNGTEGNIRVAADGVEVASHPHHFVGVTKEGHCAVVETSGNPWCHVVLRGSNNGPNYDEASIEETLTILREKKTVFPRVMIDFSHGNSQKSWERQISVCEDVCRQLEATTPPPHSQSIMGVMFESFIVSGNQSLDAEKVKTKTLVYGKSVTDPCVDWDTTVVMLKRLADAIQKRRQQNTK
eukprot:PhF_6_TR1443/c0_g1_i1/m.2564/K01626/E2.5.1.54, aroF, aroG, aroH; 3-deoxy-7-phosphoheptulonate synthase